MPSRARRRRARIGQSGRNLGGIPDRAPRARAGRGRRASGQCRSGAHALDRFQPLREQAIVLVIDGVGGTCTVPLDSAGGESDALDAVRYAYDEGITTIVIEAGGGEATEPLRRLALVGQGERESDLDELTLSTLRPADIRQFFAEGAVDISCSLPLEVRVAEDAAPLGNVYLDDDPLEYGTDWTVRGGVTLELSQGACARIVEPDEHRVWADFPCDGLPPL